MKYRNNTLVIESIEEQFTLEDVIDARLDFTNAEDEELIDKAHDDYCCLMAHIRSATTYKPQFEWSFKNMVDAFGNRDEVNCLLLDKIIKCLEIADIISFEIPEEEQTTDYPKEEEDRERYHGIE